MAQPLTVHIQAALDRFLAGDAGGKSELVTLSERRLMVLARKWLRGFPSRPDETAAVLNEAFVKLEGALDELRPRTVQEFFALASLQMRRVLLDMTRAAARRIKPVSPGGSDGGFDHPDSTDEQSHADRVADLDAAIEELDGELKEVVHLHYFQGLTHAEIGQVIGKHEDTVKRIVARAKVALARHLDGFSPDDD